MDDDRFDDLARGLGAGATRRGVLKVLGGGAAAGALALLGRRPSGAAPADKVGICHRTGSASNPLVYITVSANAVPAHAAHGDATYVDLATDVNNCGACGVVCGGDACNTEVCQGGICGTTAVDCDDRNACTADSCNPSSGCVNTPITYTPNACEVDCVCDTATGAFICGARNCNDGNACTADSCNPATGCVNTPISCDDSNACTADSCNPATGCVNTPISCDDRNVCTTDSCNPSTGCVNTPISCDDRIACTVDTCNPVSGCLYTPDNAQCVDDGNECTAEYCDPDLGCVSDPGPRNGAACDGGAGTCQNGVCDPNFCGSYILAGPGGIASPFTVDDDLRIFLNDVLIFQDANRLATVIPPFGPFAATGGNAIRFEAINSFGACQSLQEVILYCADGSATQQATEGFAQTTCDFPASATPFFVDEVVIAI